MNKNLVFIVLDKNGFGWDSSTGKKLTFDVFPSLELADSHVDEIHKKFPDEELLVLPITPSDFLK